MRTLSAAFAALLLAITPVTAATKCITSAQIIEGNKTPVLLRLEGENLTAFVHSYEYKLGKPFPDAGLVLFFGEVGDPALVSAVFKGDCLIGKPEAVNYHIVMQILGEGTI